MHQLHVDNSSCSKGNNLSCLKTNNKKTHTYKKQKHHHIFIFVWFTAVNLDCVPSVRLLLSRVLLACCMLFWIQIGQWVFWIYGSHSWNYCPVHMKAAFQLIQSTSDRWQIIKFMVCEILCLWTCHSCSLTTCFLQNWSLSV